MQYINNCELSPSSYSRTKHADLFPVLCWECSFNFLLYSSDWQACVWIAVKHATSTLKPQVWAPWVDYLYVILQSLTGFPLVLLHFTLSSSDQRDVFANNDILIFAKDKSYVLSGMRKYELKQSRTVYREQDSSTPIMLTIRVLHSETLVLTY
jgi:hypothetical protein